MSFATTTVLPLCLAAVLAGCASEPESIVRKPLNASPIPAPADVEPTITGAIFRQNMTTASLFSDRRKPQNIGDTLKVDISENLSANSQLTSTTSRDNKVASQGPGSNSDSLGSLVKGVLNMNATASGSDSFSGAGSMKNSNSFTGRLSASVINVLANGNLVIAGEKSIAFNTGISTLRFSGVVNPLDIGSGNIVASGDVVDARLELVGRGGASDANARSWLQKILTNGLLVW